MLWKKFSPSKALTWFTTCLALGGMSMMLLSTPVAAEEEDYEEPDPITDVVPGYKKCMQQAVTDRDMSACNDLAIKYWEKQTAKTYKKLQAYCNTLTQDDATPYEQDHKINVKQQCLKTVKEEQAAWQKFYKLSQSYVWYASPNRGGTAAYLDVGSMLLNILKDHYDAIVYSQQPHS